MADNFQELVDKLGLIKHPEGGYFKEVYRHPELINSQQLTAGFDGQRNLATSIYFLLTSSDVSRFHRLKSEEIWYYHTGSAVTIYTIDTKGVLKEYKLGLSLEAGETPQIIVPAGSIFGAMVNEKDSFSLVGCMVSPGFDFQDFELLTRTELIRLYPQYEDLINKLT